MTQERGTHVRYTLIMVSAGLALLAVLVLVLLTAGDRRADCAAVIERFETSGSDAVNANLINDRPGCFD